MDQFILNWIFIGASFALYIGIAVWAARVRRLNSMPRAGGVCTPPS